MTLEAVRVAELQGFLLDAAKRYVIPRRGRPADADELLGSAAALDYVLVMSSTGESDPSAFAPATVASLRSTLNRAVSVAFDFIESMLEQRNDAFEDFYKRHMLGANRIWPTIDALEAGGAIDDQNLRFRRLTLANDLLERVRRATS
jgi:hypothetical protein